MMQHLNLLLNRHLQVLWNGIKVQSQDLRIGGNQKDTLETVFNISGGSYTPPPEASQGVGGWAIVHPGTGVVHGVIVATIETYYANNGRMQIEYMGCPAGCLLRIPNNCNF